MINLLDTTFIIPVCIESIDRLNNCHSVLGYLNHHFKTNVIIHELYQDSPKLIFLNSFGNLKIEHITEEKSGPYHRTRQLNECLSKVKTDVVCNYDIDVILPIESYIISEYLLKKSLFDVVYPYGSGMFQKQIPQSFSRDIFENNFDINVLEVIEERSEFGHSQFFRTDVYKSIGGENENFISYGPEDKERYIRCLKFNLNIHRIEDYVYHFEHSRTFNSSEKNPDFQKNSLLCDRLEKMNSKNIFDYYQNIEYVKKYNFELKINNIVKDIVEKKESIQIKNKPIILPVQSQQNLCLCGQLKDKIRYNYCQKCNRLY